MVGRLWELAELYTEDTVGDPAVNVLPVSVARQLIETASLTGSIWPIWIGGETAQSIPPSCLSPSLGCLHGPVCTIVSVVGAGRLGTLRTVIRPLGASFLPSFSGLSSFCLQ